MALRYQVPQFVDIEDKIIGPLTLKQFLMYFSAVLILIPVYLYSDLSLFVTLALPVLAVATAFAFVKFGGKTLFQVGINMIGFATGGQAWMWRRTTGQQPIRVRGYDVEQRRLEEIAREIETQGKVQKEADLPDPLLNDLSPNTNDTM